MRFYQLVSTDGGPLPEGSPLQVGAIIRVHSTRSRRPGPQWNQKTGDWVSPRWVECDDPRTGAKFRIDPSIEAIR